MLVGVNAMPDQTQTLLSTLQSLRITSGMDLCARG